jgi:hypothetical protein
MQEVVPNLIGRNLSHRAVASVQVTSLPDLQTRRMSRALFAGVTFSVRAFFCYRAHSPSLKV